MIKSITLIGLGYVGLPTALLFARKKINVQAVDINKKLIKDLKNKKSNIDEPDFINLFNSKSIDKYIKFYNEINFNTDAFIICVPTPLNKKKKADLNFIKNAIISVKPFLKKNDHIIIESTISMDALNELHKILFDMIDLNINISYCPERVYPGNTINELIFNDRIIGLDNKKSKKVKKLYESFVKGKIALTDIRSAIMIKLLENTFRDNQLAFANQVRLICEEVKLDFNEIIQLANKHPRVNILNPGIGVGGHCIPVDPNFIFSFKKTTLFKESRALNESIPSYIHKKINSYLNKRSIKKISILGLSYKENIGDFRESPALKIFYKLNKNFDVRFYDPYFKNLLKINDILKNLYLNHTKILNYSNTIIILTNHSIFKEFKFKNNHVIINPSIDNFQF